MVVGSGEQDNGPKIIENTVDCIQGGKPGTFAVQNPVLYTVGDNLSRIWEHKFYCLGRLGNHSILLKYPTFEDVIFNIFMGKI